MSDFKVGTAGWSIPRAAGAAIAKWFGEEPGQQLTDDLLDGQEVG